MIIYIGIDNGVSGSIAFLDELGSVIDAFHPPVIKEQNYTKKKGNITRIDHRKLFWKFKNLMLALKASDDVRDVRVFLERPMTALNRYHAVVSGMRALESTLLVLERLKLRYQYIDSKEWQSVMLPKGSQKEQLKKDSMTIGCRLFPNYKKVILKHKDADGLLIAEWARRMKK